MTITKEAVEFAENVYDDSKDTRLHVEDIRRAYVAKRRGELEKILEGELHDMNRQVNIALAAEGEAYQKFMALTVELARSGEGLKYPLGTKMVEWEKVRDYKSSSFPWIWAKTGKTGVTEVWAPESVAPANMRWSKPQIGAEIIRHLKKDGTLSARFDIVGSWRVNWLPEGVDSRKFDE